MTVQMVGYIVKAHLSAWLHLHGLRCISCHSWFAHSRYTATQTCVCRKCGP